MPAAPRSLAAALGLIMATGAALAQDAAPLTDLSACRLDDAQVAVSLTFEGGACQEPGEATIGQDELGAYELSLSTVSTAEVCTMQIVPVSWSGTVEVPQEAETLAVTVLNPQDGVQAAGEVEIAGSEGCAEPGAEASK